MLRIGQFALPHASQQFLGLFFQINEVWLFGKLPRHNSSFCGPVSARTGKREVKTRCSEVGQVGSSLSADGVQPELQPLLYQKTCVQLFVIRSFLWRERER